MLLSSLSFHVVNSKYSQALISIYNLKENIIIIGGIGAYAFVFHSDNDLIKFQNP